MLALNLLTNGATGQKIVDYVTVQEPTLRFDGFRQIPDREFAFASGSPRDFRLDDAELRIASPRLTVNGKLDESSASRYDTVAGAVVWLYVANRGRYFLSLMPHPDLGFRKAGEVRGSSLGFTIGKDTFTLSAAGRIAARAGSVQPVRAPRSGVETHLRERESVSLQHGVRRSSGVADPQIARLSLLFLARLERRAYI